MRRPSRTSPLAASVFRYCPSCDAMLDDVCVHCPDCGVATPVFDPPRVETKPSGIVRRLGGLVVAFLRDTAWGLNDSIKAIPKVLIEGIVRLGIVLVLLAALGAMLGSLLAVILAFQDPRLRLPVVLGLVLLITLWLLLSDSGRRLVRNLKTGPWYPWPPESFNGTGTQFYGHSVGYSTANFTLTPPYVATLWLTLVNFPIVPLRSDLVRRGLITDTTNEGGLWTHGFRRSRSYTHFEVIQREPIRLVAIIRTYAEALATVGTLAAVLAIPRCDPTDPGYLLRVGRWLAILFGFILLWGGGTLLCLLVSYYFDDRGGGARPPGVVERGLIRLLEGRRTPCRPPRGRSGL